MWKVIWFLVSNAGTIYSAIDAILDAVNGKDDDKCEPKK
jgi:hypothetical protein